MKQRRLLVIFFAALLCLGFASLSSVAYAAVPPAYNGGDIDGRLVQSGNDQTFLQGGAAANICIDSSKMIRRNATVNILQNGFVDNGSSIYYTGTQLPMNAQTTFSGDCFRFRFADAAILADGSKADVVMTYSNVSFFTPGTKKGNGNNYDYGSYTYYSSIETYVAYLNNNTTGEKSVGVRSGNSGTVIHVGLEVDVTMSIVQSGSDAVVPGNFYYTMNDIDVVRNDSSNHSALYGASANNNYSEQVQIVSGAQSNAYIPAESYMCGIVDVDASASGGNGLLFTPTASDGSNSFKSGFGVLANASGITLRVRSAAGQNGQTVNTAILPEAIGALYAEKTVDSSSATPTDLTREWGVQTNINGQMANEKIVNGQMKHVGNYIKGKTFTFKETDPDLSNYETTYEVLNGASIDAQTSQSSGTGTSASGTMVCVNTVKFTNKRLWQNLTIGKNVINSKPGDGSRKWEFTLKVLDSDQNGNAPLTGLTFPSNMDWAEVGNGVYTFKLAHDERTTISLPKGCKYMITEEADPDYVQTGNFSQTELVTDQTEIFDNNYVTHDLTITKTTKNTADSAGGTFTFTVKVYKDYPEPTGRVYWTAPTLPAGFSATSAPGTYIAQISCGANDTQSVVLPDIPASYTYEVVEKKPTGWVMTSSSNTTGTMDGDKTATFTNERRPQVVTVTKVWDDDDNAFDMRSEPTVRIRVRHEEWPVEWEEDKNGWIIPNSSAWNEPNGLGTGWTKIQGGNSEAEAQRGEGNRVLNAAELFNVLKSAFEAKFPGGVEYIAYSHNEAIKYNLDFPVKLFDDYGLKYDADAWGEHTILSRVGVGNPFMADEMYRFAIYAPNLVYEDLYSQAGGWEQTGTNEWQYTFSLPADYDVVEYEETGVPAGYAVTTTNPVKATTGKLTDDDCTVTNSLIKKTLTVSKSVPVGDKTRAWEYTLTLLNPSGQPYTNLTAGILGYSGTGWDDSGKASGIYKFTLKDGESGSFTLPQGTQYTLTEETDNEYTQSYKLNGGSPVTGVSTSGTLDDDATVAYTNEKDKLNLTISKAVAGDIGSRSKYFKFTIIIECGVGTVLTLDASNASTTGVTEDAVTIYDPEEIMDANSLDDNDDENGQQITVDDAGTVRLGVYLRHGESVKLSGIPAGAKYTVTETPEEYTPSVALVGDADTNDDPSSSTERAIQTGDGVSSVEDTYLKDDTEANFTNTLTVGTPTGVYISATPALLLLAAAAALLALARLSRKSSKKMQ